MFGFVFLLDITPHFPILFIFQAEMCFHTTVKHFVTVVSCRDRQITSPTNSAVGKQSSHNKSGSTHANQKKLSSLLSDGHSVPRAAVFDP